MAQRVQVLLTCDVHGDDTEGVETVAFSLDGSAYEIDVCSQHAGALRDAFAPYVGAARRAGGSRSAAPRRGGRQRASIDRSQAQHIREWAKSQGIEVSQRGRISAAVMERYQSAHS